MDLTKLFVASGPFATIYVTQPPAERTALQAQFRWNALKSQLEDAGTPTKVLDFAEEALETRGATPVRCLVVSEDGVLLDQPLPARTELEEAHWGPLPNLLPLISHTQDLLPFVLVRIDRQGADLEVYSDRVTPADVVSVEGSHDELRSVHAGGWSDKRFEYRAMDSWEGNAKEVAAALEPLVLEIGAKLVLVSGDIQASQYLAAHASARVKPMLQRLNGHGRAVDGGENILQDKVEESVQALAALSTKEIVERFIEERGQNDLAADGATETVKALTFSQVETLLLSRAACTGTVYYGDSPNEITLDAKDLTSLGVNVSSGALCDAAVRSAVLTGARIIVVDDPNLLKDGIGALLRYRI